MTNYRNIKNVASLTSGGKKVSKISRMLDIIIHLQSRNSVKAQELADILETDLKTIYRDIESLRMANIPIESKPGRYGGFYIPKDFYFKSPRFSSDEIAALSLGGEILTKSNGFFMEKEFKSALAKIKNSISAEGMNTAAKKISSITYNVDALRTNIRENIFSIIEKSIEEKNTIEVRYYTLSRDEVKRRKLDPYHLIYKSGAWYLIAYCHWRNQVKIFRVDRIHTVTQTDLKFQIQKGFSLSQYLKNSWQITRGEEVKVEILFYPPASKYVKEMEWLPTQQIKEGPDDTIIFSAQVNGLMEIKRWILGFGRFAKVLKPQSLRKEIVEELNESISLYN